MLPRPCGQYFVLLQGRNCAIARSSAQPAVELLHLPLSTAHSLKFPRSMASLPVLGHC